MAAWTWVAWKSFGCCWSRTGSQWTPWWGMFDSRLTSTIFRGVLSIESNGSSISFCCINRLDQDTLIIWLWKESMLKLLLCVPNCCVDLLQHGRGLNFCCNWHFFVNPYKQLASGFCNYLRLRLGLFLQVGIPFCSTSSASSLSSIYTNWKPETARYCIWGLFGKQRLRAYTVFPCTDRGIILFYFSWNRLLL